MSTFCIFILRFFDLSLFLSISLSYSLGACKRKPKKIAKTKVQVASKRKEKTTRRANVYNVCLHLSTHFDYSSTFVVDFHREIHFFEGVFFSFSFSAIYTDHVLLPSIKLKIKYKSANRMFGSAI